MARKLFILSTAYPAVIARHALGCYNRATKWRPTYNSQHVEEVRSATGISEPSPLQYLQADASGRFEDGLNCRLHDDFVFGHD